VKKEKTGNQIKVSSRRGEIKDQKENNQQGKEQEEKDATESSDNWLIGFVKIITIYWITGLVTKRDKIPFFRPD
jgi:hypothetical protein